MKLNYVRRFSAYVSTFYHSEYITRKVHKEEPEFEFSRYIIAFILV